MKCNYNRKKEKPMSKDVRLLLLQEIHRQMLLTTFGYREVSLPRNLVKKVENDEQR